MAEYNSARKTGLQGITLKEDDELIAVRLTDGEDNVILVTRNGMCITFDEKAVEGVKIPFHKGAAEYYSERGITVKTAG